MTINIPFPYDSSASSYPGIKSFLKQLELAVHHAQKAVENAEKDGIKISEDSFVAFYYPSLEYLDEFKGEPKDFTSNYYEELQRVELKIVLE